MEIKEFPSNGPLLEYSLGSTSSLVIPSFGSQPRVSLTDEYFHSHLSPDARHLLITAELIGVSNISQNVCMYTYSYGNVAARLKRFFKVIVGKVSDFPQ